jgi:hypothetical protein
LTPDEIDGIRTGGLGDGLDGLVLCAVDELERDSSVSDETWAGLRAHLDDRQRMDLVFTIGGYDLLAMAVNTFGVQPEDP